jgi:hypothetical protein
MDKTPVEIGESQEGLDILYLTGSRPLLDGFNFVLGHCKSIGKKNVPKILSHISVELAFLGVGK